MAINKESDNKEVTDSPSPEDGVTPVPEAGNGSLDSLVDNIANSQPEVNAAAGTPQAQAPKADIKDDGIARDKEGNIKYKKDGVTPMKKRGRKAGATSVISNMSPLKAEQDKDLVYVKTGQISADFLISINVMALGEEFMPTKDERTGIDERLALQDAFAAYFKATNKEDIPAGWALVMVLSAYYVPRFTMPKTQTRVKTIMGRLKLWREERKLKKEELKKEKENAKENEEENKGNS